MNTPSYTQQNAITELATRNRLNRENLMGDILEDCHLAPFAQSCVNHNAIKDLSDYRGIWAQDLIVNDVINESPFDYNEDDMLSLQQRFDYFSKQQLSSHTNGFFSGERESYLLLRPTLCAFQVGSEEEKPFRNSYGWYVSDRPVSIKFRLTLINPENNLAIATFLHNNVGPQSLRKVDKGRGLDEVSHLLVDSLKQFSHSLSDLEQFSLELPRMESCA